MIVDMKFDDRFYDPIFSGTKTTTLRRSPKAERGDLFRLEGRPFVVTDVSECTDMLSVLSLWQQEGFRSAGDMLDWIEDHDYTLPLYLHNFQPFAGNTICLAGEVFKLCSKPFRSIEKQRLHTKKFEGLYKLDNGDLLDCHEWYDPVWDEEEKPPYGAIYYDIYESKAIDEEDPISLDGGTLGYSKHNTLRHFDTWLHECNQGALVEKIGEAEMRS